MKNLNAEQIKKALECCTSSDKSADCPIGCPFGDINSCEQSLMYHTRALIKELTEENERLKQGKKILEAKNERLEIICNSYVLQYGTVADKEVFLKEERTDTIRKMHERFSSLLEEEYRKYTPEGADNLFKNGSYMMWTIAESVFNQIAKDMLEGDT